MRWGVQKTKHVPDDEGFALHRESPRAQGTTAKMHFYSVHNVGEQLRWASASRKARKLDRMAGR